jgi:hypothetical protein
MCPSTDAIEMLLSEAPAEAIADSPFVAMPPCLQVLAGDQRYDAIVPPGGRVQIREVASHGQSKWPVIEGGSHVTSQDADGSQAGIRPADRPAGVVAPASGP